MHRIAFKMKLYPGKEAEYKRRHDQLWPELQQLLKNAGICHYSIFHDPETDSLIGILSIPEPENLDQLPLHETMQKWWDYMADIMETNKDNSPVSTALKEMFYLP